MNIGLIGYGKMGKEVEKIAQNFNHNVILRFNSKLNFENFYDIDSVKKVDVFIDFSTPSAFLKNFNYVAEFGKNIVVGTTGWYEKIDEIKDIVKKSGIGFVYASNFSIGMNIVFKIAQLAGKFFNKFSEYDVFIEEIHHSQKIDAPSGTALKLFEILSHEIERKKEKFIDRPSGKIPDDVIQIVSVRSGSFFGNHSVVFDSTFDTIEIKHISKGRAGFALGALKAAEFILSKKGFYKFEEILF